jgi:ComF family protein
MDYLVVPVPTATARVRERGFDHTDLLAKQIAIILRLSEAKALRRLGQTRQLGSKREDRLIQLSGNFAVKNPHRARGQDILLVDDVVTTGGSIIAAAKALRVAGAKSVDALIFAKKL